MPRARDPDRDNAFEIYKEHDGKIELIKIAEMLDRPPGTIRGWKNKDSWDDRLNGTLQKKKAERSKRKRGGQPGNKNAVGHGAPAGNKNAETHGFFSKYLPEETFAIMQEIQEKDPIDLLWENIVIQYTAIIRAQRIMYVKDQDDLTEHLKREKETHGAQSDGWEREYELQFAWDKQANFLKAQSRAMGELRSMIKQYDELLKSDLATEEQKLRIKKLKVEIERIEGNEEELQKLDKLIEAIDHAAKS